MEEKNITIEITVSGGDKLISLDSIVEPVTSYLTIPKKGVSHAYDAPLLSPGLFILLHTIPAILEIVLVALLPCNQVLFGNRHGFAVCGLVASALTMTFLIVVAFIRKSHTMYALIIDSLAGFSVGLTAFLTMHAVY